MNTLAADLLQKADGLRLENSTLSAAHATETEQLRLLIAGAASSGLRQSTALPGGALNISRRKTPHPLHISILPVPENQSPIAATTSSALVFVTDPAAAPRSRAAVMRMLYQLTPAESRVADLLLEGLEVREVADSLGITLETTRFHLKRVFARTGTRRQTELMRLMLSLPGR
jgi:DNA-binding CsgD family transcriptional regulator